MHKNILRFMESLKNHKIRKKWQKRQFSNTESSKNHLANMPLQIDTI